MAENNVIMTDLHRMILRKARICLVENLDMQILDHLVAELVINAEDEEIIAAVPTRRDRIKKLVDVLPRRGEKAYHVFMNVLKEKQHFLYEEMKKIEGEEAAAVNSVGPTGLYDIPAGGDLGNDHIQTRGIFCQATDSMNNMSFKVEDIKPDLKSEPRQPVASAPICYEITGPDVGQVIDPNQTTPLHPNKLVDQKCLSKLAGKLGGEWEALAISMGFAKAKLYHWKEDHRNNVWGQVFAFLVGWKNKKASAATIGRLITEINTFGGVDMESYRFLFFE